MTSLGKKYYYLNHPDHISRFFYWFLSVPEKPVKPTFYVEKIYGSYVDKTIAYTFLSFIILLFTSFKLIWVIIATAPITILIIHKLYLVILAFRKYSNNKASYKYSVERFPQTYKNWLEENSNRYLKYKQFIVSKVSYRFNRDTNIGKNAYLLKNELDKLNINVKQEADLQWRGVNLVPKRPDWRKNPSLNWFNQFKYSADFVYIDEEKGIILDIEIDENYHFQDTRQRNKDKQRNSIFLCNGWSIIRFKDSEILNDANQCAIEVRETIMQIDQMHNFIELQFDLFKSSELSDGNYDKKNFIEKIKNKAKKEGQHWLQYVATDYDNEVDFSDYQFKKYMAEFYGYKLSYKKGLEKLN